MNEIKTWKDVEHFLFYMLEYRKTYKLKEFVPRV